MRINIQGTNINITSSLKEWTEKKLGSLSRLHKDMRKKDELSGGVVDERVEMEVELEKTRPDQRKGKIFRAEAQFGLGGKIFRAEAVKRNIRSAVVEVRHQLERQLKQFKGKRKAEFEKGARRAKKQM